jgi:flavin-dependent dehydrogenase
MIADVLVIGGGPVGLAAAIAARRKGFRVVLADGCEPPIDKACGEGVLPDGLAVAARLGLDLPHGKSFAFRGIRFHGENVSVAADFPNGCGRGFRRTVLHEALGAQAEQCGVELRWGFAISDLNAIPARWIVGADGTNSRARAWAGLEAARRDTRRFGFRRHFQIAPWTDYVEIYWGSGCQIYITPVASDEVCVAVISRDPKLRVAAALSQFPALSARLEGVPEASHERGAVTASRHLRRVVAGNVALIGDASGSVDAISGEGLCLGFHQALALADAMESGDLAQYESAHRRLGVRPRFMADLMLSVDRWPKLRQRALPALAAHPDLFSGLLAMHVGAARTTDFAVDCLALAWRILGWRMLY